MDNLLTVVDLLMISLNCSGLNFTRRLRKLRVLLVW